MGTMPAMKSSFAVRTCEACGARFMVQSQEPLDQTSEILCPECTQIFRGHAVNSDPEATSNSLFNDNNNQTQYEDAMNFIDENGREISDFEGDEFELLAGEGSGLDSFDDSGDEDDDNDLDLDEGDEDDEGEGYDDDDYDDDDEDDGDFDDDDDDFADDNDDDDDDSAPY